MAEPGMETPGGAAAESPQTPPRSFGYWTGHFVVVASMVGAGILSTSGFTLRDTGNPAALLGLWLLGGLMALAGALTIAELATALPRAGGDYVFVRDAFGQSAAFTAGWATFIIGFAAPTAVVSHISVTYLLAPHSQWIANALSSSAAASLIPVGATALIAAITAAHCLGQRQSGRLQVAITIVKIGLLFGLAAAGLTFGRGSWTHLDAGDWPTGSQWPALAIGLIYVSYAYSGWDGAAYLAGEIRDPARLLPRCLIGGTLTVVVLYMLVNLAYVYALDPIAVRNMEPNEVEKIAELAAAHLFGQSAANVIATLIGMSLVASVSAYVLTGPRVIFAMARDGLFPRFAGRLHGTRHIPIWATMTQGVIAVAFVWSGTFQELLNYTSVGLAAVSGLVIASIFPIRRRRDLPHPYRMPLYPFLPIAYLVLVTWTIAYHLLQADKRWPAVLSLITLLLGIPLARLIKRFGPKSAN